MTDSNRTADKPPIVSEVIPRQAGPALGVGRSIGAPFIFTDWIGSQGHNAGIVSFTLQAIRPTEIGDQLIKERVDVAHLRMPVYAMRALKAAIEQVELMLQPVPGGAKN